MRKFWAWHKYLLTLLLNRPGNEPQLTEGTRNRKDVGSSRLPSFLLPCQHCGHRMAITAVTPALLENGFGSDDLGGHHHTCVQCGTTVIRTIRTHSGDAPAIAHRG
jgi:hypothetical protein